MLYKIFSLQFFLFITVILHGQNTLEPIYTPIETERINTTFVPKPANLSITQTTFSDIRDVYFLHGLGGSVQSWNLSAEHLEQHFMLREYVPPYSSYVNGNLGSAAKEVHEWIRIHNPMPNGAGRAIMVAHSQGGMVGKAMEYVSLTFPDPTFYPRKFGGLVTFGTPHGGAMILNNGDPYGSQKQIQVFLNEGCQAFSSALITNLIASNWAVSSLVYLLNFDKQLNGSIPEALCGAFSGTVIPLLMDDLASPITTDYQVGSPMVDILNNMPTQMPVVTFYGEETQPIFFKTISSFLLDARSLTPEDPFTGDDDSEFVEKANSMMSAYYSDYEFEREEGRLDYAAGQGAMAAGISKLPYCPPCAALAFATAQTLFSNSQAHFDASNANLRAYQWLHDANDNWLDIIGASQQTVHQYTFNGKCSCNYFNSYSAAFGSSPLLSHLMPAVSGSCNDNPEAIKLYRFGTRINSDPNACLCEYYTDAARSTLPLFTQREYGGSCPYGGAYEELSLYRRCVEYKEVVRTIVREPNDGVVTAASAAGYPRAVAVRKMRETNHQQMRNCSETLEAFEDLFAGEIPNTRFFKIPKR
jgi:pimeloyl-ACP methyl ester carboxylesterase